MKTSKGHTPKIRSRHPTHNALRGKLTAFPFRSIVRLGSTTPTEAIYPLSVKRGLTIVEINEADAIAISANKLLMKKAFDDASIKTAMWWVINAGMAFDNGNLNGEPRPLDVIQYPMVAKHIFGSRGTGNHLIKDRSMLDNFLKNKSDLTKYIFEKYYDYNREYRLHICKDGCFYTCRKMLKGDVPKEKRWFRNDSNSVWVKEENELFDKPTTWDAIVADCVRALDSIGLDFAAFDVRVQSKVLKGRKGAPDTANPNPEWIVIESNSAPSFGEVTAVKYGEILPKLIMDKSKQ